MTTSVKKTSGSTTDLEKVVVKFLRDNPSFFENQPALLADMNLSHDTGSAISLIEHQVSILRKQKDESKKQLNRLVENAKINEKLNAHTNSFILAVLDTHTLDELLDVIQNKLKQDFKVDAVVLRLFKSQFKNSDCHKRPEFVDWSEPVLGAFEKIIKGRKPVCGNLKKGQLDSLFDDQSELVASAALIPLMDISENTGCYGMLAIGSKDRNHFHASMGTLFLDHLAKIIARLLQNYILTRSS